MGTLGTLAVSIIGDPGGLEKTFDGVNKKAEQLGKNVQKMGQSISKVGMGMTKWVTGPIMAVGAGMFAAANKVGDYADRILDLSEITGMSTDALQEWQYVAKIAGVETEAVTKATEGLIRRLPQLEKEGGMATEQLDKLGLEFKDLKEMNPDEMMNELIGRLSAMEDPLERNAIGAQLFGGAWKDIAPILGLGADAIADARDEAHKLGAVMGQEALDEANNYRMEVERLKVEMGALGRGLTSDVIPVLMTLIPIIKDSIVPAIRSFAESIAQVFEWYGNLDPELQKFILAGIGIVAALGPLLIIVGKVITAIGIISGAVTAVGGVFAGVALGPLVLIVGAIAAVIAIGVLLYKNWDTVKEKIGAAWEWIKERFASARDSISGIIDGVIDFFADIPERIRKALSGVVEKITGPFNTAKDKLSGITDTAKGFLNRLNPFSKHSPSLVEQVSRGTQKMLQDFKRLETDLSIAPLAHTLKETDHGSLNVGGRVEVVVTGDGAQHLNENSIAEAVTNKIIESISNGNRRVPNRTSLVPG